MTMTNDGDRPSRLQLPKPLSEHKRLGISTGKVHADSLTADGDAWTWKGEATGCTAIFTEGRKVQTALYIRLDDGGQWVPSMEVVLTKVV